MNPEDRQPECAREAQEMRAESIGERASQDNTLLIRVKRDGIVAAHILGRHRENRSIDLFGARWSVYRIWDDEPDDRPDFMQVVLTRASRDLQTMCWVCGSFTWDRVNFDDPAYCVDCGSRDLEGLPS